MSNYFKNMEKHKCYGCKACSQICPTSCITMEIDDEGFWYPQIQAKRCINCGMCQKVCPYDESSYNKKNEISEVYAAINKNFDVKMSSSSGGVFTALSDYIIDNGGVVFGAEYNDEFVVEHGYAENKNDCNKFKTSKYVQSDINITYKQALEFLKSGRLVLFTGTPCQVAGLYGFLMKDYKNLITMDFVCHGVPSPKVFGEYRNYISKKYNSQIININFKDKSLGWFNPSLRVEFENGSYYCNKLKDDPYIKLWQPLELTNRPSCHQCKFTKTDRESDITIGDFWGIQNSMPEFMDNMGTSLLILNTKKGEKMLIKVENKLKIKKSNIEVAYQPNLLVPTPMGTGRKRFFKELNTKDFSYIVNKYSKKPSIYIRINNKLRRVIRSMRKLR